MANDPSKPTAPDDNSETLQMSDAEVARLHAELAAAAARPKTGTAPIDPAPHAEPLHAHRPEPAPAAVVRPTAAQPPAPARPAPPMASPAMPQPAHHAAGGSGALVVGGIGAILVLLALVAFLVPFFQGVDGDMVELMYTLGFTVGAVGYGMLAGGLIGAAKRTNGAAGAAAIAAYLTAVVLLLTFVLGIAEALDRDIARYLTFGSQILAGVVWILVGVWAFTATRQLGGAVGGLLGVFALLGGLSVAAAWALPLAEVIRRMDDDMFIALLLGGSGLLALAAIFSMVAFFGPLQRARRV